MRGHFRHGRRRGPGPRRIARFVEPCLLLLLRRGPSHGYSLIEGLKTFGFGDDLAASGAAYRYLRRLEHDGLVVSEWDTDSSAGPARRVYSLTREGDEALGWWVEELEGTDRILQRFLEAYRRQAAQERGENAPERVPGDEQE